MNIVRTLTIFLMLAALSFVLGFFILARVIPGVPRTASSVGSVEAPAPDPSPDKSNTRALSPSPTAMPTAKPVVTASDSPVQTPEEQTTEAASTPGPSLDPVNEKPAVISTPKIQKPHKLKTVAVNYPSRHSEDTAPAAEEAPQPETSKPAPAEETSPVVRPKPVEESPPVTRPRKHKSTPRVRPAEISESSNTGDDSASEATTVRVSPPRKVRHHRADTSNSDSGDQGDNEKPKTKAKFHDAETVGSGLFRVHLGAFHSRDAAAQEVARARTKGFDTQIVQVTRNGRTLYRVQAGAFRDRGRAESAQQSLQDANLDARISDPQR